MLRSVSRRAVILALALVAVALLAPSAGARAARGPAAFAYGRRADWSALAGRSDRVRTVTVHYRAHDGAARIAVVVLPRWYGPLDHPAIPLVISPHGSGIEPAANARRWGNLRALGPFGVVNPEGQGARLELYSWGSPGEVADLARMPSILRETIPWLRIDRRRIYAVGGSMGGQESLLLLAKHPHLLAGVVSFDPPTNIAP